jgi:hypothetical protein
MILSKLVESSIKNCKRVSFKQINEIGVSVLISRLIPPRLDLQMRPGNSGDTILNSTSKPLRKIHSLVQHADDFDRIVGHNIENHLMPAMHLT